MLRQLKAEKVAQLFEKLEHQQKFGLKSTEVIETASEAKISLEKLLEEIKKKV